MRSALLRCVHSWLRPRLRSNGGGWLPRIAAQPLGHVEVKELLAPDHAGKRLTLDKPGVGIGNILLQLGVEFVGFATALSEEGVEVGE